MIFGYNGRDGVVTDTNGLFYMRARYYSPEMRRFINADIVAGEISNAITLNRFAYANGNPVSFVDPFGLWSLKDAWNKFTTWVEEKVADPVIDFGKKILDTGIEIADKVTETGKKAIEYIAIDVPQKIDATISKGFEKIKSSVTGHTVVNSKFTQTLSKENLVKASDNVQNAIKEIVHDIGKVADTIVHLPLYAWESITCDIGTSTNSETIQKHPESIMKSFQMVPSYRAGLFMEY